MQDSALQVTDEEVKSLTQSILGRYGLDFTCYEQQSLRRRVVRILSLYKFGSVVELWARLLKDPTFIYSFMNEISVGMTSMFRDPVLWKKLSTRMKEELCEQETLSIWHAGCSTGEEVFTLGIILNELKLKAQVKAFASDINQDAIQTARLGKYHKIRMLENQNNYKQYNVYSDLTRYYTVEGKEALMHKSLTDHVTYGFHNLIHDPVTTTYDIIFCRNVMIYFDAPAKCKLLAKFYEALKPGGYFIIGFFDTILSIVDNSILELVDEEAKIFRKIS